LKASAWPGLTCMRKKTGSVYCIFIPAPFFTKCIVKQKQSKALTHSRIYSRNYSCHQMCLSDRLNQAHPHFLVGTLVACLLEHYVGIGMK
jgi:hypothetical protein